MNFEKKIGFLSLSESAIDESTDFIIYQVITIMIINEKG